MVAPEVVHKAPDTVLGDMFDTHLPNLRLQVESSPGLPIDNQSNLTELNVFQLTDPKEYAVGLWYASIIVSQHEIHENGPGIYPLSRELVDLGITHVVMAERYGDDFNIDLVEEDSPEHLAWSSFMRDISGKSSDELTGNLLSHIQRFDLLS